MLRFESLEQLGQWATKYGVASVRFGADGALAAVRFAGSPVPVDLGDGLRAEDDKRPLSEIDRALDRMMAAHQGGERD